MMLARSTSNIPAGAAFQYAYNDTLGGWDRRRNNVASTPLVTQTGSVATRNSADLVNWARRLGISRRALLYKLEKYGIKG